MYGSYPDAELASLELINTKLGGADMKPKNITQGLIYRDKQTNKNQEILTDDDPFWLLSSSVHRSSHLRWHQRHGGGFSEPAAATDRHLSTWQRRGVSGQPARPLGAGHRHPESTAAGFANTHSTHTFKHSNGHPGIDTVCVCVFAGASGGADGSRSV